MESVKISVIVPAYNCEKYIDECLKSIAGQSMKDIEIICVNDGSTDSTAQLLKMWAKKDTRIKVLHQENLYAGVARNNGLKTASGKYVHFMDADDILSHKEIYGRLYEILEKNGLDFIKCKTRLFDSETGEKLASEWFEMAQIDKEYFNKPFCLKDNPKTFATMPNTVWSAIYNKNFLDENNIKCNCLKCANDVSFTVLCQLKAKKFMLSDDYIVKHRKNVKTSLSSNYAETFECRRKSFELVYQICHETCHAEGKSAKRAILKTTISDVFTHFDSIVKKITDKDALEKFEAENKEFIEYLSDYKQKLEEDGLLKKIFSVTNTQDKRHKVFTVFGVRFKFLKTPKQNAKLPSKVRLEACALCQLNCKSCYMRLKEETVTAGRGYLKFDDFKKFVDKHRFVKIIELSNNGEIFLNPELLDIIKYAHKKGVTLQASNGVNFNTVSDAMLEALVKYDFSYLNFSIDGASSEIYAQYRQKGDFDKVISNIRKLIAYKQKYNSELPRMRWQYVLMNHNECDVTKAKALAKELDMPIKFKLTWEENYIPNNPKMLKKETGLEHLSREEFAKSENANYEAHICRQLWDFPTINWDGRLLGCCSMYYDDFGVNVFEVGLKKALKSKKIRLAKKILLGKKVSGDIDIPCTKCHLYKKMSENKSWLKR